MATSGSGDSTESASLLMVNVIENDLLLRHVLENLAAKDLTAARLVHKKWTSIVLRILVNRKSENMFLIYYPQKSWTNFEPKSHGKVLEKGQRFLQSMVNESKEIMKIVCKEHARNRVMEFVENRMQCIPKCVLLFSSSWEMTIGQTSAFPQNCDLITIHAPAGVVCSPGVNSVPIEIEKRPFLVDAMAYSLLSRYFSDYKITITDWGDPTSKRPDPNDPEYPLKSILLFSTAEEAEVFEEFLENVPNKIAIGGAVVDRILIRGLNEPSVLMTMAFSGKNLQAASLVLNEQMNQKHGMQKLMSFRESLGFDVDLNDQYNQTIGFVFICAGRGRFYYNQKFNVESEILHKTFPKVSFTGLFGGGEYGHDCYGENNEPCDSKCRADHIRGYTTVVVLIHFNKKEI